MSSQEKDNQKDSHHQEKKPQTSEDSSKEGSFLGIKFSNNNEESARVDIMGLPVQSQETISFGLTPGITMGGINADSQSNLSATLSPAIKDLLNKVELAIKSNNIDQNTINIFNQLSQLSNINDIVSHSPIVTMASIANLREKERELIKETTISTQNTTPQNQIMDDASIRKMWLNFSEERANPQQAIKENNEEKSVGNNLHSSQSAGFSNNI